MATTATTTTANSSASTATATTKARDGNGQHEQDVIHLFHAIRKGKAHLTRFMLAASSTTLLNCVDNNGRTPLMECCYIREEATRVNMVKIVRDAGADVNQKDSTGRTALAHACQQRCNDVVRILIMHCRIVPDLEDVDGNTALIHSSRIGNDVAVELLVRNFRRLGLQIDHFNKEGFTALHLAAKGGFLQCAKILAVKGKSTLTLKDKVAQRTPMEWCIAEGYQKSEVEFLKPLAKFYKVARLTTTIVKCRKRSACQETLSSMPSLKVSPIKAVKKVKQKSISILRRSKLQTNETSECVAGSLPDPPTGIDNENALHKGVTQGNHALSTEPTSRGDKSTPSCSTTLSDPNASHVNLTDRTKSSDTKKSPDVLRHNSKSKPVFKHANYMPFIEARSTQGQINEYKSALATIPSPDMSLRSSNETESESSNDDNLIKNMESLATWNFDILSVTDSSTCSQTNERDVHSSSSTNTLSPSIVLSESSSDVGYSRSSTFSNASCHDASSSSTEDCTEVSESTEGIDSISVNTEIEFIDTNGCKSPVQPFPRKLTLPYHNTGRDSASPQTDVDDLSQDENSYSGGRTSRLLLISNDDIEEEEYCQTLEPFITNQFLKLTEPAVDALSETCPELSKKTTCADNCIGVGKSMDYCKTGDVYRVTGNVTAVVSDADERSMNSSPDTIVDALEILDVRDDVLGCGVNRAEVLKEVDEGCEFDLAPHNVSYEKE